MKNVTGDKCHACMKNVTVVTTSSMRLRECVCHDTGTCKPHAQHAVACTMSVHTLSVTFLLACDLCAVRGIQEPQPRQTSRQRIFVRDRGVGPRAVCSVEHAYISICMRTSAYACVHQHTCIHLQVPRRSAFLHVTSAP